MAIHISTIQNRGIASQPAGQVPAKTTKPTTFSTLLNSIASNKPVQRTSAATTSGSTTGSTSTLPMPVASGATAPATPPCSSDGTSLANLMAAASYANVSCSDLTSLYNGTANGAYDPNWQTKLANAIEARLQSAAGSGTANQIYDPNPANDSVPIDLTNTKQFSSSSSQINDLLNNMWSAVHAGDVSAYHTALQQVDSWYQSNGQQNYYTGLTDGQVAAFNPANGANLSSASPNANSAVAAAELAAITGQSAPMSNLAAIAQSAIKT